MDRAKHTILHILIHHRHRIYSYLSKQFGNGESPPFICTAPTHKLATCPVDKCT
uniref:Uncharacterized protein n=1 Tax=Aegilops tauschii subsp. strangulata TaxID=200361 RepID=A0A453FLX0_AEGTS